MSLSRLLDAVRDCSIDDVLSLSQFLTIFSLVSHLRARFGWSQTPDSTGLPLILPTDVLGFLSSALDIDEEVILKIWHVLRPFLADAPAKHEDNAMYDSPLQNASLLPLFLEHGLAFGIGNKIRFIFSSCCLTYIQIGFFDLFPPTQVCLDPRCSFGGKASDIHELTSVSRYRVVLFTRFMGAVPVWAYSAECVGNVNHSHY